MSEKVFRAQIWASNQHRKIYTQCLELLSRAYGAGAWKVEITFVDHKRIAELEAALADASLALAFYQNPDVIDPQFDEETGETYYEEFPGNEEWGTRAICSFERIEKILGRVKELDARSDKFLEGK